MRSLRLVGALFVVATAADAQPVQVFGPNAGATVMDFNAYSAYTNITNQYAGLGISTSSCIQTLDINTANFGGDVMQAANFNYRGQNYGGHS